jgi:hypothetical protein
LPILISALSPVLEGSFSAIFLRRGIKLTVIVIRRNNNENYNALTKFIEEQRIGGGMATFPRMNKYLLAKNVFESLTFFNLKSLNELSESIYSSLEKELAAYDSYVRRITKKMSKEMHEEFLDHMSDDYWKYSEEFPQITGYILLVRYYSLLECALRSICQKVEQNLPTKMKNVKRRTSYVEYYVKYLRNEARFNIDMNNVSWKYIKGTIKPIRNCITHDDGYIKKSDKADELKKIINDNPTLLSLTSHQQIRIEKAFVEKIQTIIEAFFTHVFQVWQAWAEAKK